MNKANRLCVVIVAAILACARADAQRLGYIATEGDATSNQQLLVVEGGYSVATCVQDYLSKRSAIVHGGDTCHVIGGVLVQTKEYDQIVGAACVRTRFILPLGGTGPVEGLYLRSHRLYGWMPVTDGTMVWTLRTEDPIGTLTKIVIVGEDVQAVVAVGRRAFFFYADGGGVGYDLETGSWFGPFVTPPAAAAAYDGTRLWIAGPGAPVLATMDPVTLAVQDRAADVGGIPLTSAAGRCGGYAAVAGPTVIASFEHGVRVGLIGQEAAEQHPRLAIDANLGVWFSERNDVGDPRGFVLVYDWHLTRYDHFLELPSAVTALAATTP